MMPYASSAATRHLLGASLVLALAGCRSVPADRLAAEPHCVNQSNCPNATGVASDLAQARQHADRARASTSQSVAADEWVRCALSARRADDSNPAIGDTASVLATQCSDGFLRLALHKPSRRWEPGPTTVAGVRIQVEFVDLSPNLNAPVTLVRSADIPVERWVTTRHLSVGFGVPLAAFSPRCEGRVECELFPPEGIFRWGTAWLEPSIESDGLPRLVVANSFSAGPLSNGSGRRPLAVDVSAPYARGARTSKLPRFGVLGLFGGQTIGRRVGVYLLDDYDPAKRPLVMIHGLGSSPLIWARLSNAVWGDPVLRSCFQVWHVVYDTSPPALVTRRRVQGYLDRAWELLDPDHDDAARSGVVLVGHSLGGVLARLLTANSGTTLWDAAFLAPPESLRGDRNDVDAIREVFDFRAYSGVTRAIFLAAPHKGSPRAERGLGRLVRALAGHRAEELQVLRRVTQANPDAVRDSLRGEYLRGRLNSITTLRPEQPVRRAGQALLPVASVQYHTIAGELPGTDPPWDGVVPLDSASVPGASSTLVIPADHFLYRNEAAIAEVIRILRADIDEPVACRDRAASLHCRGVPVDGKSQGDPGLEPAGQGAHAPETLRFEQQGQSRGGRFVRAIAVDDDLVLVDDVQLRRLGDEQGSGNPSRGVALLDGADIEHQRRFATFDHPVQVMGRDSRHADRAHELFSPPDLVGDECGDEPEQQQQAGVAESFETREHVIQCLVEYRAERDGERGPEQRSQAIEQEEPRSAGAGLAGHRRCHRGKAGHEFRDDQRARAPARIDVPRGADAGIRGQGEAAHPAYQVAAVPAAALVPDPVGEKSSNRGHQQDRPQRFVVTHGQSTGHKDRRIGGHRHAALVEYDSQEHDQQAVMFDQLDQGFHGGSGVLPSGRVFAKWGSGTPGSRPSAAGFGESSPDHALSPRLVRGSLIIPKMEHLMHTACIEHHLGNNSMAAQPGFQGVKSTSGSGPLSHWRPKS